MTGARSVEEWEEAVQAVATAANLRRAGAVRAVNALGRDGWLLIRHEHWAELEAAACPGSGSLPERQPMASWDATPEERAAADERLKRNKAFDAAQDAEVTAIAVRALERIDADEAASRENREEA